MLVLKKLVPFDVDDTLALWGSHEGDKVEFLNPYYNIIEKFVPNHKHIEELKKLDYKVQDVYNPPSFIIENGTLKNPAKWLWNYYQYYRDCKNISGQS